MANVKIHVKLILQLRDAGMSRQEIASTRHISRNSVSEVFRIADEKGIHYADVRNLGENEVYRIIYPDKHQEEVMFEAPDYEYIHKELKKPGVTLKLLHDEYIEKCTARGTIPMGKTKFNEGYAEYMLQNNLTGRISHKPGERCEVGWSGTDMHYIDTQTGELIKVHLFVATLPYSQYSYVEPCLKMDMDSFLRCHVHMYEYFGGVPTRTVCDNLKTGVVSHPKEGDIILTADYEAPGEHYMTAIMPARVRKPKDKPSVEGTVGKIATAVIAKLRNSEFTSLASLKSAVREKLDAFNRADFQKRDYSRYQVWNEEEKSYLRPLPALPYEISRWEYGRSVNIDFHVVYKKNRYSCPYQYVGKKVDLRLSNSLLEIYYKGERISTHSRFPEYVHNRYSTHPEDMPPAFRGIVEWDQDRITSWASSIGKSTRIVIDRVFEGARVKEQGYNPSLAILRLSKTYSDGRLENACELALSRGIKSPRYHHLSAILKANQDEQYQEEKETKEPLKDSSLGYLRGADYYRRRGDIHAE